MDPRVTGVKRTRTVGGVLVAVLLLGGWVALKHGSQRSTAMLAGPVPTSDRLGREDSLPPAMLSELILPESHRLPSGSSLVGFLQDSAGLDRIGAHAAAQAIAQHHDPRQLRAGTGLLVYRGNAGEAAHMVLPILDRGEIRLDRVGSSDWRSSFQAFEERTRTRRIAGTVEGGFESAVVRASGPSHVAYAVADVLQWDLDFNRDLRVGDEFTVLFDERLINGRSRETTEVHAVHYRSGDRVLTAYRFQDGYYDASGRALRKQFLRSPLPYSRVTSRFTRRRFHPVLKTYRPHYGVDYGAPTGTPVRVTANGVVASAAWSNGGGNTVKVRHANGYLTAYLHLSGFAKGVRSGRRVTQGDIIGVVGSTGLSTGPHLDYRVQQNGKWIDPLQLNSQPVPPLDEGALEAFEVVRSELDRQMQLGRLAEARQPRAVLPRSKSDSPAP